MAFAQLLVVAVSHTIPSRPLLAGEQVPDVLVQLALVGLHRKQVICAPSHHLTGDVLLAAHGVYRYQAPFQFQHLLINDN